MCCFYLSVLLFNFSAADSPPARYYQRAGRTYTLWKAYTGRLYAGAERGSEEWPFKSALVLDFFSLLASNFVVLLCTSFRDSSQKRPAFSFQVSKIRE